MDIPLFLKHLRESSDCIHTIFTQGSCFRLFLALKALFPQANPYYSQTEGHWITEIDHKYYDIGGELSSNYVDHNNYELITSSTMLLNASIPRHSPMPENRICTSYSKYIN